MDLKQVASDLQNMDMSDLQRIGVAPNAVKGLVIVLAFIALSAAGLWFIVQPMTDELASNENKEATGVMVKTFTELFC